LDYQIYDFSSQKTRLLSFKDNPLFRPTLKIREINEYNTAQYPDNLKGYNTAKHPDNVETFNTVKKLLKSIIRNWVPFIKWSRSFLISFSKANCILEEYCEDSWFYSLSSLFLTFSQTFTNGKVISIPSSSILSNQNDYTDHRLIIFTDLLTEESRIPLLKKIKLINTDTSFIFKGTKGIKISGITPQIVNLCKTLNRNYISMVQGKETISTLNIKRLLEVDYLNYVIGCIKEEFCTI
jgi:hypothetical protein